MDSRVVNALAAISVATFLFLGFGGGIGFLVGGGKANAGGGTAVQATETSVSAADLSSGRHSETVAKLEK
ncbi:hypothetical protein TSH58p_15635 [Azospirillum sp. TSH58]|uniref:hypothetical protein n=1 Tax=Azospirillum sp. TSH58 TaxID=664962 RepID=UPI000D5FEFC3|nr:hypothetical protein [Azospirillum sp. TSH58]AWJ84830.1 hypothetical protein TSH58p_15635 [Azospirillum sp. TSH58]PWC68654.1 hypothetical protein TSH58_16445 [Azospirillum sp. TSH58]